MNIKQLNKYRYLGLNIAYYRKERGLSQESLAELVNSLLGIKKDLIPIVNSRKRDEV